MANLYHDIILDHYRKPRHRGRPAGACREAHAVNPLCGDEVTVFVDEAGQVAFDGRGCAISLASASILAVELGPLGADQREVITTEFLRMMTEDGAAPPAHWSAERQALWSIREFPTRIPCATLPWRAFAELTETSSSVEGAR